MFYCIFQYTFVQCNTLEVSRECNGIEEKTHEKRKVQEQQLRKEMIDM